MIEMTNEGDESTETPYWNLISQETHTDTTQTQSTDNNLPSTTFILVKGTSNDNIKFTWRYSLNKAVVFKENVLILVAGNSGHIKYKTFSEETTTYIKNKKDINLQDLCRIVFYHNKDICSLRISLIKLLSDDKNVPHYILLDFFEECEPLEPYTCEVASIMKTFGIIYSFLTSRTSVSNTLRNVIVTSTHDIGKNTSFDIVHDARMFL